MASSSNPDQDSIHLHILVTESQLDPHSQDPVHWKSQFIWLQHLSEVHIKLSPLVHDFLLEYVAIHWLPLHQWLLHCPLYLHPSRGSSRKLKHQSSKVPSKPILEQHLKSLSAYCPHLSELHCVLSSSGRDTPLAWRVWPCTCCHCTNRFCTARRSCNQCHYRILYIFIYAGVASSSLL